MSRYFTIQLSGTDSSGPTAFYLTDSGADDGRPCKNELIGAALLQTPTIGNTTVANNGVPFTEKPVFPGGGRPFEIRVAHIPADVWENLRNFIDYTIAQDGTMSMTATGEPGTIEADMVPNFGPTPYDYDKFSGGWVKGVVLRFITKPPPPE